MPEDSQDGSRQGIRISRSWLTFGPLHVNLWLVALTAVLILAAVAFGGARISDADHSGASYQQVHELARLGAAIAGVHGLASALEDEEDSIGNYVAVGRPRASLLDLQAHYAITNLAGLQVQTLASRIGTGYPPQVRAAVAQVLGNIKQLKVFRSQATGTPVPAREVLNNYTDSISGLLALNDRIAGTSGDPQLSADVQELDALSRASDAAAQQRAILNVVLARGSWQSGESLDLISANAELTTKVAKFRATLVVTEWTAYQNSISGPLADTSNGMLHTALSSGQAGTVPGNPTYSGFPTAAQTWDEGQTFIIDRMRQFEQRILGSIQARSQALQSQAAQTVTETWIETASFLAVIVAIAGVAAWRSSPSRRIHWI